MERLHKRIDGGLWRRTWKPGRKPLGTVKKLIRLYAGDVAALQARGVNVSEFARNAVHGLVENLGYTNPLTQ